MLTPSPPTPPMIRSGPRSELQSESDDDACDARARRKNERKHQRCLVVAELSAGAALSVPAALSGVLEGLPAMEAHVTAERLCRRVGHPDWRLRSRLPEVSLDVHVFAVQSASHRTDERHAARIRLGWRSAKSGEPPSGGSFFRARITRLRDEAARRAPDASGTGIPPSSGTPNPPKARCGNEAGFALSGA